MPAGLSFIDEFWKEPDRAVIVGLRSLSDFREIRIEHPTAPLLRLNWKDAKAYLAVELNRKMEAAGIDAKPRSGWSARTAK